MSKSAARVWTMVVCVLLSALTGVVVGYGLSLAVTVRLSQNSLFKYAAEHAIDFEKPPDEARELLAVMNASPYPYCSEKELSFFRQLLLKSRFLKDLGRMRGGRLACSAQIPVAELQQTQYEPSFPGLDGTSVYIQMESLRVGPLTPIVIRMGDAYAAIDPYNRNVMPPAVEFTLSSKAAAQGKSNYLGGNHTDLPANVLTRNATGRIKGTLYATHCSARYTGCMTLYVPLGLVLREQHGQIALYSAVSGVISGCFGLMGIVSYRRKKGIEQQLRRAIKKKTLRVVYQPLVDLKTRKVTGAEALVRWTDEDRLVIPPDIFIKIAEERGFVDQITRLVVRRVLTDFGRYLSEHPNFQINVNVAANDLTDPAFHTMLEEALGQAKVSPGTLGIEITEGATAKHEQAIKAIAHLRHRGHHVYIDDFGTGYSSLAYLKDLAVDGIKIDRAFTSAIGTGAVTVGILPQILSIADALHLSVVAEGIETKAQYAYYNANALSITGQGWLFGHPVPPEDFRQRWLTTPNPAIAVADAEPASSPRSRPADVPALQRPVLAGRGAN